MRGLKEIIIEHKQYQKDIFLTEDENYHGTQPKDYLVFSCADMEFLKNQSLKALNLVQNGNFSDLSLFCRPFMLP